MTIKRGNNTFFAPSLLFLGGRSITCQSAPQDDSLRGSSGGSYGTFAD